MPVTFEMRVPPGGNAPEEYVSIQGQGKDVVCKRASDFHRERYAAEYAAFLATLAPVVVKPASAPTPGLEFEPEPMPPKKSGFFGKKKA